MQSLKPAGFPPEEIAINRNATEGLNTVIFGLNLKAGDEVVLTKQDYPNMLNAWKQREKRDGIKLVYLNLELPSEDDDALAAQDPPSIPHSFCAIHLLRGGEDGRPIDEFALKLSKQIGDSGLAFLRVCDLF